eukprot:GEMP01047211.1.p1 GENE.GEMP01047211.1~~GEMP01047211.1.p1  ORF type:complete len:122 (+),score=26.81 GEMP01047211.1:39-404(+)
MAASQWIAEREFKLANPEIARRNTPPNIVVGLRCNVPLRGRGEIIYVGQPAGLQRTFLGVKLDEPYGNSDGTFLDGVRYFETHEKYGIYIAPTEVDIGDFPPVDPFAELEEFEREQHVTTK